MDEDRLDLVDDEAAPAPPPDSSGRWQVLVVDDAPEVHSVTRLVLSRFEFEGRRLELLDAFSAAEARRLLREEPGIALILLDVVMETDTAGLDLAREIREVMHNRMVRIVLRTGQPGMAPEREVILDYDINDYKEKSELTAQKLFTTVVASLRDYGRLLALDRSRRGLERVVGATKDLFAPANLSAFAAGILDQLAALLGADEGTLYVEAGGIAASRGGSSYNVLAASGAFVHLSGASEAELPPHIVAAFERADAADGLDFQDRSLAASYHPAGTERYYLYILARRRPDALDRQLLGLFSANIGAAFRNLAMNRSIVETQFDVTATIAEVLEGRALETVNHVRRVGEYARLLCRLAGLGEEEAELVRAAAPMHDIGKIGIADGIISKPGPLTDVERRIVETHAEIGYRILSRSDRSLFRVARRIALEHHEHWDGTGYPGGLAGEATSLYGRVVALADVFDALLCRRAYKEAWDEDRAFAFIAAEGGRMFEPRLASLFLGHREEFTAILRLFPDELPDARSIRD